METNTTSNQPDKKQSKKFIIIGAFVLLLFIGVFYMAMAKYNQAEKAKAEKAPVQITLDKAMYNPGDSIHLSFSTDKADLGDSRGKYQITVKYLNKTVDVLTGDWAADGQGKIAETVEWTSPNEDFKGYLFEVALLDTKDELLNVATSAADVSSTWTKFPRYGFLTNFDKDVDTKAVIDQMKDWQLNGIEYYDWKFLHHQLIPEDGSMEWHDWAGRPISGETVKSYIADAKDKNMANMSYNMIYAATNNYASYGIKDEWGLWYAEDHESGKNKGDRFTFSMGASPTGQSNLFFFDIQNPEWQDYIIEKNLEALKVMGFDGWHGDTVGEWGKMWSSDMLGDDSQGFYVKDGYKDFLDKAKERLEGYQLSFNPVGAQGIEQVNASAVDVLYAEIWPWDHDSEGVQYNTYNSLKREVDQSRKESGGKSLIIPAYMEYDYADSVIDQPFNQSAVLLTDAAVYAAGGSRIELGDGQAMLSSEYFPKHHLYMTEEHMARQKGLQDFIVAYQNLLRDGLEDNGNLIAIEGHDQSADGEPDTIWAYSKSGNEHDTIQLINLVGVSDNEWRANDGQKETPELLTDMTVKYYTDASFKSAWVTSPDPAYQSQSRELEMETGQDANGNFISVKIPSLEYWDMIYFSQTASEPNDQNETIGVVE